MKQLCLSLGLILIALYPAFSADPPVADLKAPGALSPDDERKSFQVAPGFEVSLVAAEPNVIDPVSMTFDQANPSETCTGRERSNTPLQALATLNDPQFVEAARHLAEFALTPNRRPEEALDAMAERLLARPLNAKERAIVEQTLREMQSFYERQPEAAKALLTAGDSKPSDKIAAPQLAAMTMVANQLMNLDEVLNK